MRRPRSHQLEDESRTEFRRVLPTTWVARDKASDYGIDLEVEVFDESGLSTGLMFYVQLKATSTEGKQRSVRLDRQHLEYYDSLDVPTLIVRFASSTKQLCYRWRFSVPYPKGDSNTVAVAFSDEDIWTIDTPPSIISTLRSWRLVRHHDPKHPIAMVVENRGLAAGEYQKRIRALRRAVSTVPGLAFQKPVGELCIVCRFSATSISFLVADISIVSIGIDSFDDDLAVATVLYGTIMLFRGARNLAGFTADLAELALRAAIVCPNAELAFQASLAARNAAGAADLAILNRLYKTPFGQAVLGSLLFRPFQEPDRAGAYLRLASAVLHELLGTPAEAAVRYSIGNFHASIHDHLSACREFNLARKLDPAYCRRAYFLGEFGATFYNRGHYAMAATLYRSSVDLDQNPLGYVHLGDALLFSGKLADAVESFNQAAAGSDRKLAVQASLKLWLSETLVAAFGPIVQRECKAANDLAKASELDNFGAILLLDPFHLVANYNAGASAARDKDWGAAVVHFLLCAVKDNWDLDAWNNAIGCAMNLGDPALGMIILETALHLAGEEAVTGFRDQFLAKFGAEQTAQLDDVIFDLGTKERDEAVIRLHRPDGKFEVITRGTVAGRR